MQKLFCGFTITFMRNDYKLIIFDMDGTILNTIDDLKDSLNFTLAHFGYPLKNESEVNAITGKGIRYLVEQGLPKGLDNEVIDKVFNFFAEYYAIHCNDKTKPYIGVVETISKIKKAGYMCAVLSNKVHSAVLDLCKMHFDGLFDFILGKVDGMKAKPDPDGVERILDAAELTEKDALMVGDSEIDIQTGYNAKVDVVGASYGFRDRSVLEKMGVENIISKPTELIKLLEIR